MTGLEKMKEKLVVGSVQMKKMRSRFFSPFIMSEVNEKLVVGSALNVHT